VKTKNFSKNVLELFLSLYLILCVIGGLKAATIAGSDECQALDKFKKGLNAPAYTYNLGYLAIFWLFWPTTDCGNSIVYAPVVVEDGGKVAKVALKQTTRLYANSATQGMSNDNP
jgi:hypothetical protein